MTNPNGAVAGNAQNVPEAQTPRTRSTFPLHYHFFNTHRFGEYIPHYVEDVCKGDRLPIHSSSQLRSYTLDAPLMQNVKRNKDYFLVPMEAILPLNWEKFFDNPVRGDDVLDDVGPSVGNFWKKAATFMNGLQLSLQSLLTTSGTTAVQALQATLRFLIIGEYFYSNGSLMTSLGCHGARYVRVSRTVNGASLRSSWDKFFDGMIITIQNSLTTGSWNFSVDGYNYVVVPGYSNTSPGSHVITMRHALQLMRDNPFFEITSYTGASTFVSDLYTKYQEYSISYIGAEIPFDSSRLSAYQLCCAHYFSNDHIDFVYSAELFRQLIGSYLEGYGSYVDTFTRNGIKYRYDYLSGHALNHSIGANWSTSQFGYILNDGISTTRAYVPGVLGHLSAIFGYRRSLRYLDYFTGARAQMLAVVGTQSGLNGGISTEVSVNSNKVSVIDITKSIQAQRFLNAVNRVRHSFEGYLKGIFGGQMPAPDYHNPFYLAHTDDVVYGQETENTGAAQMTDNIAITTNLRSNSGNYMFDCEADRPCIAIGITSYDITRVYTKSMERSFLYSNRFDWFNPFMQYVGDQAIYLQEIGISPTTSDLVNLRNFAYTIRHEEYKQRYSQGAGGFVENLPGWCFIASDERGDQKNINPDWIRSLNSEFDQFYVSLTGYSLGSYFHFIVDDFNSVNASRPMAFAPTIL